MKISNFFKRNQKTIMITFPHILVENVNIVVKNHPDSYTFFGQVYEVQYM